VYHHTDVFLCYSWVDKLRADELRDALIGAGLTVFQDEPGMRDYDLISERIDAALRSARVLVVLYTPSLPTSEYCRQEIHFALLRSYRPQDWPAWLQAAGADGVVARGPLFDSSWIMVQAAMQGVGVALAPAVMFESELAAGRLVRPFALEIEAGAYWFTHLKTRAPTPGLDAFRHWLLDAARQTF